MQISGCSGQNWSWEELHRNRQISADYLRCGNRPYPAWNMRVTAQILSQRRIRRYFVLPLKAAGKQRDLSHVRFTQPEQDVIAILDELCSYCLIRNLEITDTNGKIHIYSYEGGGEWVLFLIAASLLMYTENEAKMEVNMRKNAVRRRTSENQHCAGAPSENTGTSGG